MLAKLNVFNLDLSVGVMHSVKLAYVLTCLAFKLVEKAFDTSLVAGFLHWLQLARLVLLQLFCSILKLLCQVLVLSLKLFDLGVALTLK